MTTIVCDRCLGEFEADAFAHHPCPEKEGPPLPADVAKDIDAAFGALGVSPETHEEGRIADLAQSPLVGEELPAIPVKAAAELATREEGVRTAVLMRPVIREMSRQLQGEVDKLRADIQDSNRLLKHLDVPLEEVANSHERAASSFENLRAEIRAISVRLGAVESVIDTAGLTTAMSAAEERMHSLAAAIRSQFTETSKNMAEVLRLLQKLQDRDLEHTRGRMKRSSRRAVNKLRSQPA